MNEEQKTERKPYETPCLVIYGDIAQIEIPGGPGNVRQRGVVRMKRQWNEGNEAVGLVLHFDLQRSQGPIE